MPPENETHIESSHPKFKSLLTVWVLSIISVGSSIIVPKVLPLNQAGDNVGNIGHPPELDPRWQTDGGNAYIEISLPHLNEAARDPNPRINPVEGNTRLFLPIPGEIMELISEIDESHLVGLITSDDEQKVTVHDSNGPTEIASMQTMFGNNFIVTRPELMITTPESLKGQLDRLYKENMISVKQYEFLLYEANPFNQNGRKIITWDEEGNYTFDNMPENAETILNNRGLLVAVSGHELAIVPGRGAEIDTDFETIFIDRETGYKRSVSTSNLENPTDGTLWAVGNIGNGFYDLNGRFIGIGYTTITPVTNREFNENNTIGRYVRVDYDSGKFIDIESAAMNFANQNEIIDPNFLVTNTVFSNIGLNSKYQLVEIEQVIEERKDFNYLIYDVENNIFHDINPDILALISGLGFGTTDIDYNINLSFGYTSTDEAIFSLSFNVEGINGNYHIRFITEDGKVAIHHLDLEGFLPEGSKITNYHGIIFVNDTNDTPNGIENSIQKLTGITWQAENGEYYFGIFNPITRLPVLFYPTQEDEDYITHVFIGNSGKDQYGKEIVASSIIKIFYDRETHTGGDFIDKEETIKFGYIRSHKLGEDEGNISFDLMLFIDGHQEDFGTVVTTPKILEEITRNPSMIFEYFDIIENGNQKILTPKIPESRTFLNFFTDQIVNSTQGITPDIREQEDEEYIQRFSYTRNYDGKVFEIILQDPQVMGINSRNSYDLPFITMQISSNDNNDRPYTREYEIVYLPETRYIQDGQIIIQQGGWYARYIDDNTDPREWVYHYKFLGSEDLEHSMNKTEGLIALLGN